MFVPAHSQRLLELACKSDSIVLITGPTGSGKTTLARKIHEQSSRRSKPFVQINLATLHEGTLEAELFGYEKGAFTGAENRRVGRLEMGQGGTVFLDEVGELPLRLQARLLDFLHSRTIMPMGSNREVRLDVRIIAATHRDLRRAVSAGEFREDLFHRLRVVTIPMGSLVERADEFDELVHECLRTACQKAGRSILRITEETARKLETYSWPGNLRELQHVLEYAVLASEGDEIQVSDLPSWFGEQPSDWAAAITPKNTVGNSDFVFPKTSEAALAVDFYTAISRFEKEYLTWALRRSRGRISRAARQIGMNKTTLIRRIRVHGLVEEVG